MSVKTKEQLARLVGWLFNGTSTQKGQYVPTAAQSAKDGQRDTTMHITLRYTITM